MRWGFEMRDHTITLERRFAPFAAKMQQAGLPDLVIDAFRYSYAQLLHGETGYIPGDLAQPVAKAPDYERLDPKLANIGREVLARTVMLKLNGGLGTSMGMSGPKSLVPVKQGLSFLDITVRQVQHLRQTANIRMPLLLMDSFTTQEATLAALAACSDFEQDLPFDFLQHKIPKIWKHDFSPAVWPDEPEKEWCPPGHGDIYAALVTSNMLAQLLEQDYTYLFVSNSDNLGAVLDPLILGYIADAEVPFLMEVAQRTSADRKGGHLAQQPNGQLILREAAQCPPEEIDDFQNIEKYRYFNTNNLWIHLPSLYAVLNQTNGVLDLPLIRNEKPVDPTRPDSPRVYQLETAMGSAIGVFQGAEALCVPRRRFAPVKKNGDLLALWSDAYELTEDYQIVVIPTLEGSAPTVTLDDRYFGLISDLLLRFPHGAPSLLQCTAFEVQGDVRFGRNVVVQGRVRLVNLGPEPMMIADETVLTGDQ